MSFPAQNGILLINLGTPEAPTKSAVRHYLREFLSDPEVIRLPLPLRWLLVRGAILPFRSQRSAELYQKIWTDEGSPLLVNSQRLCASLQRELNHNFRVVLGMRYGKPSLKSAMDQLADCHRIIVFPLFPQYATATSRSAITAVLQLAEQRKKECVVIQSFYNHATYINGLARIIKKNTDDNPDYLLMSYHGIPERHDPAHCYRAQCFETSRLVASVLQWPDERYGVAFQSRLGRLSWIKPYTVERLSQLAEKKVKRLAVVCPSFVADCLETLEEIGLRAKEQWERLGGESFRLIPALNSDPDWVKALSDMIRGSLDAAKRNPGIP